MATNFYSTLVSAKLNQIAEMSNFLRKQPTVIKEYDEKLVRRLIDKVTVYEDLFELVFRSGVMVEVEG